MTTDRLPSSLHLPWPVGWPWTDQRSLAAPAGGCTEWQPLCWLGCRTAASRPPCPTLWRATWRWNSILNRPVSKIKHVNSGRNKADKTKVILVSLTLLLNRRGWNSGAEQGAFIFNNLRYLAALLLCFCYWASLKIIKVFWLFLFIYISVLTPINEKKTGLFKHVFLFHFWSVIHTCALSSRLMIIKWLKSGWLWLQHKFSQQKGSSSGDGEVGGRNHQESHWFLSNRCDAKAIQGYWHASD